MPTLVATIDVHLADARSRVKRLGLRASHGDIDNLREGSFQLALGESETFEVKRFFYAHLRDVTTVELTDPATGITLSKQEVVGIISLPMAMTVRLSVPSNSPISLERVIHVIYG